NLSGVTRDDADFSQVVTITSEDDPPLINIGEITYNTTGIVLTDNHIGEGDGSVNIEFTLNDDAGELLASEKDVSIGYAINSISSTATLDQDYSGLPATGKVEIAAGETSTTFTVPITEDYIDEDEQTIVLELQSQADDPTNFSNIRLGTSATATITIDDNDPAPVVYIKDTSPTENNEGNSDDTQYTLSLGLTRASEKTITIPFSYDNAPDEDESPAGEDTDFEMDTDPDIIIEVGGTTAEINFTVLSDATDEYDQTIYFEIEADGGDNTNVNTADADDNYPEASYPFKWEYTITNDDSPPNISITSEASADESETQDVTLTLVPASEKPILIDFDVTDGTAIKLIGPNTNYDPTDAGTEPQNYPKADFNFATAQMGFAAGETVAAFTVTGLDDDIYEGDETFTITITAADDAATADINEAENVAIGTGTATVTITSDDPKPNVGFIESGILISEA
ncbi:uncharacterized protein METZ01_LOCUS245382, partial [marine metagenome]